MGNTGMNRKLDTLGRIVIPAEIRKLLGLKPGSVLMICMEGDRIILAPRQDSCVFCGATSRLKKYRNRLVCIKDLKGLRTLGRKS